jgi:hypothetical protein
MPGHSARNPTGRGVILDLIAFDTHTGEQDIATTADPALVRAFRRERDAYAAVAQKLEAVRAVVGEVLPPRRPAGQAPKAPYQSARDLATKLSLPFAAVDSFLRRYRKKFPDCCIETESPRRNEPRHLYRVADVWPALEEHFHKSK